MRSIDLDRRRLEGLRTRALAKRASVQIVVGALAIAAIALAFVFRPGQATTSNTQVPTPVAKATATVGAPVALPAPVPTAVATPTPQPKERSHTVVAGDNLSKIAEQYYGDASKFQKVFEANKDVLKTPDSLQVGQKLRIPE